jgi:hypothetical protein
VTVATDPSEDRPAALVCRSWTREATTLGPFSIRSPAAATANDLAPSSRAGRLLAALPTALDAWRRWLADTASRTLLHLDPRH